MYHWCTNLQSASFQHIWSPRDQLFTEVPYIPHSTNTFSIILAVNYVFDSITEECVWLLVQNAQKKSYISSSFSSNNQRKFVHCFFRHADTKLKKKYVEINNKRTIKCKNLPNVFFFFQCSACLSLLSRITAIHYMQIWQLTSCVFFLFYLLKKVLCNCCLLKLQTFQV